MAYNSEELLGPELRKAILKGDRAEAWYEIAFNSNGNDLKGIAKRRFYEADTFGLWEGDKPTWKEIKDFARMLDKHNNDKFAEYIEKYGIIDPNDGQTSALEIAISEFGLDPDRISLEGIFSRLGIKLDSLIIEKGSLSMALDFFANQVEACSELNCLLTGLNNFYSAVPVLPTKYDPLIIDLDGDGIETVASTDGAYFDHDGNGFAERTGWAAADDGFIVMDRDGDGRISSGQELFGDQTIMTNGERAAGAFQALADLDGNADGKIDANDAAFSEIKVWQDLDGDGYSTADELKTLAELGISALNTGYTETSTPDGQGNTQIQAGIFDKTDNTTDQMGGFLLQRDTAYTIAEEWLDVPADIAILPDLQGYGNVYDLHQAIVRDTDGQLKALVESFIATTDAIERNNLMDQILYKWTGTENVNPSSRGPNIDARRLEALEMLFGQTFVGDDGSGNPNGNAASLLNQSYQGMFEMCYAQLMAQTHLQDLYGAITYSWDEITESVKGDLTPVLAEIQNSAALDRDACRLVVLEFMRTIKGMQGQDMLNIGDFNDAVSAWDKEFGSLVDSINGNLFYGSSVEDSLFGNDGSDAIVGFQGADFILGFGGNDVLLGGLGDDTILGYDGNDTLIGSDGNDSLYGENDNDLLDGGAGDDYLDGGSGDDVFIYGRGSGNDIIQRYSAWSGNSNGIDTIQFGER